MSFFLFVHFWGTNSGYWLQQHKTIMPISWALFSKFVNSWYLYFPLSFSASTMDEDFGFGTELSIFSWYYGMPLHPSVFYITSNLYCIFYLLVLYFLSLNVHWVGTFINYQFPVTLLSFVIQFRITIKIGSLPDKTSFCRWRPRLQTRPSHYLYA
jgi:hypothetical protein